MIKIIILIYLIVGWALCMRIMGNILEDEAHRDTSTHIIVLGLLSITVLWLPITMIAFFNSYREYKKKERNQ